MITDERKDWIEIFVGGACGVGAIIAAIVEYALGDGGAVAGMFKDILGTLVVVVILFAAMPKPKKSDFVSRMTNALEVWMESNSNMISRTSKMPKGHENDFGISMKTDMNDFYNDVSTTKRAGRFVRLPEIKEETYSKGNVELSFYLNEETFFGRGHGLEKDIITEEFDKLSKLFARFINRNFEGFASAVGKEDTIKVVVKSSISSDKEIERLVELINTAYTAYLVSSHIKVK